jgi:hypothetical protein
VIDLLDLNAPAGFSFNNLDLDNVGGNTLVRADTAPGGGFEFALLIEDSNTLAGHYNNSDFIV